MLQTFPRGRSAMKGGRSAMLQTFPQGYAMLHIFQGKVCNVANLPGGRFAMLQCCRPSGGKVCNTTPGLSFGHKA